MPSSALSAGKDRRARELFRFVPVEHLRKQKSKNRESSFNASALAAPNINDAVLPFVQLVAVQCGVPYALLTVMDQDIMYKLASSTDQIAGHIDLTKEPTIWQGCPQMSLNGQACEKTLDAQGDRTEEYAFFTVPDLTEDESLSKLSFADAEPHCKFYCGTPIITPDGVSIGSLAVMDTEVKAELSNRQKVCLGVIAEHVMSYLVINSQAIEGRRSLKMSNVLRCFVEGKRAMKDLQAESASKRPPNHKKKSRSVQASLAESRDGLTFMQRPEEAETIMRPRTSTTNLPGSLIDEDEAESDESTGSGVDVEIDSRLHSAHGGHRRTGAQDTEPTEKILERAAHLIHDGLEVDDAGGVVFIAIKNRLAHSSSHPPSGHVGQLTGSTDSSIKSEDQHNLFSPRSRLQKNPVSRNRHPRSASLHRSRILAIAAGRQSVKSANRAQFQERFERMEPDMLYDLCITFPVGALWSFDGRGKLLATPTEEHNSPASHDDACESPRSRTEVLHDLEIHLFSKFPPEATQVLFAPLWDPSNSQWASVCFVWLVDETRVFTPTSEVNWVSSSGKTIMAEISRAQTILADRQKADFIGNVSHELRSPLHGVLACAEFLAETGLGDYQRSLLSTLEACGKGLLETINHVLDYSKLASRGANGSKPSFHEHKPTGKTSTSLQSSAPPDDDAVLCDIAALAEEVADSVAVAQAYGNMADKGDSRDMKKHQPLKHRGRSPVAKQGATMSEGSLEVVLNIENADWKVLTQPGLLRRVITNLLGNSMKYTSSGTIEVHLALDVKRSNDGVELEELLLTFRDTGKGISQDYLDSKLFSPFAQEDTLAPGAGLGLSIVHSLVQTLKGTIDVQSEEGKGTTFRVRLPLTRQSLKHGTSVTPAIASETSDCTDFSDAICFLRSNTVVWPVSVFLAKGGQAHSRFSDSLKTSMLYLDKWYGISPSVSSCDGADAATAGVVIIDERDLLDFTHQASAARASKSNVMVVLCKNVSHQNQAQGDLCSAGFAGNVYCVAKPFGPRKFAKVLRTCFQQLQHSRASSHHSDTSTTVTIRQSIMVDPVICHISNMDLEGNASGQLPLQTREDDAEVGVQTAPSTTTSNGYISTPESRSFPESTSPSSSPRNDSSGSSSSIHESPEATKGHIQPRVLIVEDNKINRQVLETLLKKKRMYTDVQAVENGLQGVNAVKDSNGIFDVIFMDLSLPVMDGLVATAEIRKWEQSKDYPGGALEIGSRKEGLGRTEARVNRALIIALTGRANAKDREDAFEAGVDMYLMKPVRMREVGDLLEEWELRHSDNRAFNGHIRGK